MTLEEIAFELEYLSNTFLARTSNAVRSK